MSACGTVFAEHANDAAAREFFSSGFILPALRRVSANSGWSLLFLILLPLFFARRRPDG